MFLLRCICVHVLLLLTILNRHTSCATSVYVNKGVYLIINPFRIGWLRLLVLLLVPGPLSGSLCPSPSQYTSEAEFNLLQITGNNPRFSTRSDVVTIPNEAIKDWPRGVASLRRFKELQRRYQCNSYLLLKWGDASRHSPLQDCPQLLAR